MFSRVLFTLACIFILGIQDGTADFSQCTPRTPIAVTMSELEGTWYLVMYVNAKEEEKTGNCMQTTYVHDVATNTYTSSKTIFKEGSDENVTTVNDIVMVSPGVYDHTSKQDDTIKIHVVYMDYMHDEMFIDAHCEVRNGVLYTDRVTAAVKQRSLINLDSIRQRLNALGIATTKENEYIIPQDKCKI